MPTPIGHALGGLFAGLMVGPRRTGRAGQADGGPARGAALIWPALAACLPDLDFLWGRHNMETHSIGFALLVGVAVLVWSRQSRLALASGLAVGTHVLFDWLGSDDSPPLGVMALWPVSSDFYFADAFVFEAISRRYWLPNFYTHNVLAVLRELVILVPLVAGAWFLSRRQ